MKKIIAILLASLMFATLLTGCAADYSANEWVSRQAFTVEETLAVEVAPDAPAAAPLPLPVEIPEMEVDMAWDDEFGWAADGGAFTDDAAPFMPEMPVLPDAPPPSFPDLPTPPQIGAGDGFAERIIHTATASIETLEFDATIDRVYQMLAANGGFVEFSEVGGRNHWQIQHNLPSYRFASFTLRVPQERLAAITGDLEVLGNVISINNFAENITAQFVDTETRLSTLLVQEERLLDMLTRADEVSDMIEIEQRLGEVRFQIESMVSTLRNWENRIRFSTLNLFIHEVHEYTEIEERNVPYWQQVWNGLMNTFRNIGQFFMNLLMWFIVHLPTIIIIVVAFIIALIIILRITRKHRNHIKEARAKLKAIPKVTKGKKAAEKEDNDSKNEDSDSSDNT